MKTIFAIALLLLATPALAEGQRAALVDNATGRVINVVEANSTDKAPQGQTLVPSTTANIGDSWDGSNIIPKPQPFDPRHPN